MWRAALGVLLAGAGIACGEGQAPEAAPVPVEVAPVGQRDVKVIREWIGTTEGNVDAEIRAQVTGYLTERAYREGTLVKKGDLLFRIDPRPFRAALDQARGDLGRATAARVKAEQDVKRFTPLAADGAVSQQELDNAVQAARAGRASVEAAQAVVSKAEVELSFTEIRSPIDGIVGIAEAQLGDLVGPQSGKALTTVSQVDPIVLAAPISEREYLKFAELVSKTLESGPSSQNYPLELVLADGSVFPHGGKIVVTNREIDPRTGTIMMKGEFPNPGYTVRPGQYGRVRVTSQTLTGAVVVPQRAISELQGTHQVAVVGADDTVTMRVVQVGPQDGSDQVIEKGLSPGDRIVVEGVQKVRNGVKVAPLTEVASPGQGASQGDAKAASEPAPEG